MPEETHAQKYLKIIEECRTKFFDYVIFPWLMVALELIAAAALVALARAAYEYILYLLK